jgi:rubrerythrin
MDLSIYSLEDLLLAALKSEIESEKVYSKLSDDVKNAFLKDKLKFLASEEVKHKSFVESMYKDRFPHKEIALPEKTPVPLPEIKMEGSISEIIGSAMDAEKATYDFYNSLSEKFVKNPALKRTLVYLAVMEMGHYKLLELEKETMEKYEDYDTAWPMIHLGP